MEHRQNGGLAATLLSPFSLKLFLQRRISCGTTEASLCGDFPASEEMKLSLMTDHKEGWDADLQVGTSVSFICLLLTVFFSPAVLEGGEMPLGSHRHRPGMPTVRLSTQSLHKFIVPLKYS